MRSFTSFLKTSLLIIFQLILFNQINAQEFTHTIKGIIVDADSKYPVPGLIIRLSGTVAITTSDSLGYFRFEEVPLQTYFLEVSGIGYEETRIPDIIVNAGKETFVSISVKESIHQLSAVTVTAGSRDRPLNEFASASARPVGLEMAERFPANGFDPARLVQNFAGVSFADDKSNSMVIRGNSPMGVLWQLEGIEIPNPNHFSSTGGGGGNISMLSSSTMDKSDFYTGAFPAEFGNAISGVFDLKLRTGNSEKYEHSFMFGSLGIEAATEGPIKKGSNATYLVNARYSTLALVKSFAEISGISPDYQDISFKLNFPTRKTGTFSFFGLGGTNISKQEPEIFQGPFNFPPPFTLIRNIEKRNMGVGGITHQFFFNKKSFIKTVIGVTTDNYNQKTDTLDATENYTANPIGRGKFNSTSFITSLLFNHKLSNRLTQQLGITTELRKFNYQDDVYDLLQKAWYTFYESKGKGMMYKAYAQLKWRMLEEVSVTSGIHYTYLALNKTYSYDPRFAISYQANRHNFILGGGLHSKAEHLSVYNFINGRNPAESGANRNLGLTKAGHLVLSYALRNKNNNLIKVEMYYQQLYNVPVEKNQESFFSMLNSVDIFDLYQLDSALVNDGKGKNYGVDITLERSLVNGIHYMITASLFSSSYTTYEGKEFNSKFNRGYQLNTIIGREWATGRSSKNSIGFNIKGLLAGGLRESPIDETQSEERGEIVYVKDRYYDQHLPFYFRIDAGVSYKINRHHTTHILMLDFQNVLNRKNVFRRSYDVRSKQNQDEYGLGLFPIFNYRLVF